MKAILLAGGMGSRLRPLTLHTPKPIVPIFDRPFLHYQIEILKSLPEIDEAILSLNYQPESIEAVFKDGSDAGLPIRYVVEPNPRGTGGAVKFIEPYLNGTVIVFNGDVLTKIDLPALLRLHRARNASATIVLTPVNNPTAYGLVETDADGNVRRFLEKPNPADITCNTINAGIYILEPDTFERIPTETHYSIERKYFPSLIERGETFVAYTDRGYWLDIGTPEKYLQAHRDIMSGRFAAYPFADQPPNQPLVAPEAIVDPSADLRGPCYVGAGARIEANARIVANAVVGANVTVRAGATIDGSIVWENTIVGPEATVSDSIVGRNCLIEAHASIGPDVVLGDGSVIASYSRTT
jgi:mannose-1-phosphate guanylyltransferase